MAQNDYVKLPNQGSITSNLRLLYEMEISFGYADTSGYFTKRDVAEIGANALLITTGAKVGDKVVDTLSTEIDEEMNSALQNAKMRMQILRLLGLISTDYDSEIYAITKFGQLITPENPNRKLLLELFMNICSCTEVYEHNCDLKFFCYPGYQICYAFAALDYKISSTEMPVLMTYGIHDIQQFVQDAKDYREKGVSFSKEHPHYPKTQRGTAIKQPSNLTRTSNQILRFCGVIERKQIRANGKNFYVCTEFGKEYCDKIKRSIDRKEIKFLSPYEFRKSSIGQQKRYCQTGIDNILARAGYDISLRDTNIVFSPYQMIPETNISWLMDSPVRKHPEKKDTQITAINSEISLRDLRLTAIYNANVASLVTIKSDDELLINLFINAYQNGYERNEFISELCEQHKTDDKTTFYSFVHSLLRIIGLECVGEVGRYDAYASFNEHVIPVEIKSYTETTSYNIKGIRQSIENKICSYNPHLVNDVDYATLVVGFSHPALDNDIRAMIDAAHEHYQIKVIATDIRSLVSICVSKIWDKKTIDLQKLLTGYGLLNE